MKVNTKGIFVKNLRFIFISTFYKILSLCIFISVALLVISYLRKYQTYNVDWQIELIKESVRLNNTQQILNKDKFELSNHSVRSKKNNKTDTIIFPSLKLVANLKVSTKIDNKSCEAIILKESDFLDSHGNTVVAIHRFAPLCPYFKTFISANSLKKGDPILIYWKNNLYSYTIQVVKEVNVSETAYLMPTAQDILTIYTCTYKKDHRLIIIANKDGD